MYQRTATTRWASSPLVRALGTTAGVVDLALAVFLVLERDGGALEWTLPAVVLTGCGTVFLALAWTSSLAVEDRDLVARHFYGTERLPLSMVTQATPELAGLVFVSSAAGCAPSWVVGSAPSAGSAPRGSVARSKPLPQRGAATERAQLDGDRRSGVVSARSRSW